MPIGVYNFESVASFAWAGAGRGLAGTLVTLTADETCNAGSASTLKPLGILWEDVEIGGIASIILAGTGGIVQCIAGGAVALNDMLTTDASGRAITTTTVTHWVWGICRKVAANANEYTMIQLVGDHVITA